MESGHKHYCFDEIIFENSRSAGEKDYRRWWKIAHCLRKQVFHFGAISRIDFSWLIQNETEPGTLLAFHGKMLWVPVTTTMAQIRW